MGQREAAEKTRKKYGLETFSHTTLGRAIIKLSELITECEPAREHEQAANAGEIEKRREFPTVEASKKRKETVQRYIKESVPKRNAAEISYETEKINYKHPPYKGIYIERCHEIAENTFIKYRRLLL
jgi:hypothetical protein